MENIKTITKSNMGKKINVLVSGGGGLVGSRIIELLSSKYNLISLSRSDGFDITSYDSFSRLNNSSAGYFLHLAAKTDVDGCENEKELGEKSEAWKINVKGTENVVKFCSLNNIKLIYMSTDFVFDGEKNEGESYVEEDVPNPINFYAKTKYEAEKIVVSSGIEYVILRMAYPYRKEFEEKKDFARAIINRLRQGLRIKAVKDHIMCPTFIDDVAFVVDKIIEKDASGIYHVVGDTPISPYEVALKIVDKFNMDKSLVDETTREEYFKGKAKRPFNLYLKNDKIKSLGVTMKTFDQGLAEMN